MKNFGLLIVSTFMCVVVMGLFATDAQAQGRRPGPPPRPGREMAPPPPHREVAPPREYQMVWERLPDGRWIYRQVEVRPAARPHHPEPPRPDHHHPAPPRPDHHHPAPPRPDHHPAPYYPEPSVGRAVGTLIDAAIRGDL